MTCLLLCRFSTVSGRAQHLWLCWIKPRTSSSGRDCWPDLFSVLTWSLRDSSRYDTVKTELSTLAVVWMFCTEAESTFPSGWRLRSVWNLYHPAVHSSELVWYLLQVRLKDREPLTGIMKLKQRCNCVSCVSAGWFRVRLLTWRTCWPC